MAKGSKAAARPIHTGLATPTFGCGSNVGTVAEHLLDALAKAGVTAGTLGATNVRGYNQPNPAPDDYTSVISLHEPSTWRLDAAVRRMFGIIALPYASPQAAWLDSIRLAQRIYAPSAWSVEAIGGKTELMRFGVDPFYKFAPKKRGSKFQALIFGEDLADRRLGYDIAVAAFKLAFQERDDVELLVHSTQPRDLPKDDVRIRISAGMMTPMQRADLYRCADVLVHPARAEAFGFTPLEAMACGTPALHSGATGMADFADLGLVAMNRAVPGPDGEWREPFAEEIAMLLQFAYDEWDTLRAKAADDAAEIAKRFPWNFKPLISRL